MRTRHYSFAALTAIFLIGITLLSGCKKKEEPVPATPTAEEMLVGLWGVYTISTPAPDNQYAEYFRLGKDNVLEHFGWSGNEFYYNKGTYKYFNSTIDPGTYTKTDNSHIEFNYKQTRKYVLAKGKLILIEYSSDIVDNLGFVIQDQKENSIKYKNQNRAGYLHAVTSLPDKWDPELTAPEVQPTKQNLLGQWDHTNVNIFEQNLIHYWYFDDPAMCGITLLPDNEVTNCKFWIDYIWAQALSMETISKDNGIFVNYYDCTWDLGAGILPLTCSRYSVGHYDAAGNFVKEDVISPETPIRQNFSIEHMTDYYLILIAYDYQHKGVGHFVFHKHPDSPQDAPAAPAAPQRRYTPLAGQYQLQELPACDQWKR